MMMNTWGLFLFACNFGTKVIGQTTANMLTSPIAEAVSHFLPWLAFCIFILGCTQCHSFNSFRCVLLWWHVACVVLSGSLGKSELVDDITLGSSFHIVFRYTIILSFYCLLPISIQHFLAIFSCVLVGYWPTWNIPRLMLGVIGCELTFSYIDSFNIFPLDYYVILVAEIPIYLLQFKSCLEIEQVNGYFSSIPYWLS